MPDCFYQIFWREIDLSRCRSRLDGLWRRAPSSDRYLKPKIQEQTNCCPPTNSPTSLCACCRVPESQQRVAACYLNLIGQIRMLYLSYCSSHPSAVCVLTDHRSVLTGISVLHDMHLHLMDMLICSEMSISLVMQVKWNVFVDNHRL